MNKLKEIDKLKRKAKEYYMAYCSIANMYDCGLSMAEYLSTDMVHYKNEFNKVMDELRELDPTVPDGKL